jgi:hypothetical protein
MLVENSSFWGTPSAYAVVGRRRRPEPTVYIHLCRGVVGALTVCILGGMLFMMYRNPERAKLLLVSFVNQEFKILLATTSDVWDIVGTMTTT